MNNLIIPNCAADEEVEAIESMEQLDQLFSDEQAEDEPTKSDDTTEVVEEKKEEVSETAPNVQPDTQTFTKAEVNKSNQAFAAMRAQLSEQNKLLQKVADSRGVSLDTLRDQLNQEAVETAAKQMNVSPEVYKRLSDLEEENRRKNEALEAMQRADVENRQRSYIVNGMNSIQKEFGLSDAEAADAVRGMISSGFNILDSNIPLELLYRGLNYEKLIESRIEEARQEWIKKDSSAASHSSTPVKGTGANDSTEGEIMTLEDLDRLLR